MNKILTVLPLAAFVIGCASTQNVSPYAPTERDVVAKAQAYGDLNYGQYHDTIHAVAQTDTRFERAPAEAEMLPKEQGGSKAEADTVISQVRIEQRVDGNGERR